MAHLERFEQYRPTLDSGLVREGAPQKEGYVVAFSALTISGRSGTGKTATAHVLRERLGIPEQRFVKVGEILRDEVRNRTGEEMVGFANRSEEWDRHIDGLQKALLKGASVQDPLILEGRLSGILASEAREESPEGKGPIVSLLFTAQNEVRVHRRFRQLQEVAPLITSRKVRHAMQEREQGDLAQWQKVHPELTGIDPFHPHLRKNGRLVYDLEVSTNSLSVQEVADLIVGLLENKGYIRKSFQQEQTSFSGQ